MDYQFTTSTDFVLNTELNKGETVLEPHNDVLAHMENALNFMHTAKRLQTTGDYKSKDYTIRRAVFHIDNLRDRLNFQAVGELAFSLENIFNYMIQKLGDSWQDNYKHIDEAAQMMYDLKEGWARMPLDLAMEEHTVH